MDQQIIDVWKGIKTQVDSIIKADKSNLEINITNPTRVNFDNPFLENIPTGETIITISIIPKRGKP